MSTRRKLRWTDPISERAEPGSVRGLQERNLSAVFQPIVAMGSGATIAHEALTRCLVEPFTSPVRLFQQAALEQACGRLGRLVRNVVFERCERAPVFVNLHPQELSQRWLVQPTDPIFLHDAPVFLEITESAAFRYFDVCLSVLSEVRSRSDARLVVDDFGSGHSNMDRVLTLRPSIVKLDMSLIRDLDQHADKRRQVAEIVTHCHGLGCEVVAEGVETTGELSAVIDAGIEYAQGYLLGRPTAELQPGRWPQGPESHTRLRRSPPAQRSQAARTHTSASRERVATGTEHAGLEIETPDRYETLPQRVQTK